MKYYLIAGERSGDLHGGNLIRAILRNDPDAQFRGFGGEQMQTAGMELVVHYDQLAFMGVVKVLLNFRKISGYFRQCTDDLLRWKPDVVILIDYGGFNMRIARKIKPLGTRVFYYISPKVWAWNTGRAHKLKATVDRMFCILPFEKDFFSKFDWDVDYVGNPVLDAVKAFKSNVAFRDSNRLPGDRPVVALLPGSRRGEVERIAPLMADTAGRFPTIHFAVAAVNTLPRSLYRPLENLPNVQLVFEQTYDLLQNSTAAVVTSGTATLETALHRVPQVCVYITAPIEYAIGKRLLKVPYISLVNLILNKPAIAELLQHEATLDRLSEELKPLLEDGPRRKQMLSDYAELYQALDTGSASDNAGRLMVHYLKA